MRVLGETQGNMVVEFL